MCSSPRADIGSCGAPSVCPTPQRAARVSSLNGVGMRTIAGISVHQGWAECVTVRVQDRAPLILDRRRAMLIASDLPCAPYHHEGLVLPLAEAEALVARARQSVVEHTREILSGLQSSFAVGAVVLQESPFKKLPDSLADVLKSWSLTCAADGMMYREGLVGSAVELGLDVVRYPRKSDQLAATAEDCGVARETVAALLAALGRGLGPPWRKEHQEAAASALRVLAGQGELRL